MTDVLFYQNYTPAADFSTLAICTVYWFLLRSTYTSKQKNLTMFKLATSLVSVAALSSIIYHQLIDQICSEAVLPIYFFRDLSYTALILTFNIFCIYIRNLVSLKESNRKIFNYMTWIPFSIYVVYNTITPLTHLGFYIDHDLNIHQNYYTEPFRFFYMYYIVIIVALLIVHKRMFITKMYQCIRNVMLLSLLIMAIQYNFLQSSYICITFTLPIMAILFLFHYNSYDSETGTLDFHSFNAYIHDLGDKKFSLIFLYLDGMSTAKMRGLSEHFFHFSEKFFKHACTFRLQDEKLVMITEDDKNENFEQTFPNIINDFLELYQIYHMDYRLVSIRSNVSLKTGDDYLALDEFLEESMEINSVYQCSSADIVNYEKSSYILKELKDIHLKGNLNDERVLVFCQPVLNTQTNVFSSAEALMRLNLKECGMVFPDQFIPLAEKHGYIHTLSKIILNKTCKYIRTFEREGYQLDRVSVNFSIPELRDLNFCNDVTKIIEDSEIDFGKIAIELTESRNEQDFEMVKGIMYRLQELGIKFYLDDFGTGYSNFERITGLPIDIIKFDRSLTILARKDQESRFLVGSFSDIFKQSHYQILFEGVEDDIDEDQCKEMNAMYLQGYKYSRPIPMDDLREFLSKEVA